MPDEHVPASLVLRKLCTKKSRWFSFILVLKFSSSWVLNSETVVMLAWELLSWLVVFLSLVLFFELPNIYIRCSFPTTWGDHVRSSRGHSSCSFGRVFFEYHPSSGGTVTGPSGFFPLSVMPNAHVVSAGTGLTAFSFSLLIPNGWAWILLIWAMSTILWGYFRVCHFPPLWFVFPREASTSRWPNLWDLIVRNLSYVCPLGIGCRWPKRRAVPGTGMSE